MIKTIQEICTVVRGSSPRPQGDPRYYGGKIPRLMVSDLTRDGMYVTPIIDSLTEEGALKSRPMKKGEVVIAVSGNPGEPCILAIDACIHDGFVGLRDLDVKIAYPPYLYQYLKFIKETNKAQAVGAIYKNLNTDQIKSFQIPLPPLDTQKKIAAILDAADAYRQKTKTLIDKYDQLAQSLFLDMFGDPVRNEKGWEKSATINYCSCIVPGRDKPKSFTGDIPWVTTSDLNHLGFTENSNSNIGLSKSEISEVKAKIIPKGSVIMTCVGDLGIISINSNPVVVNQQLHAFQCFERLNNLFLMYNLSHQTPYMHKMASSTTVPYMNKTIANNIPTIVPPIDLQNQFAERIQLIEAQKQQAQASLQKAEDLFNSLLQKAFSVTEQSRSAATERSRSEGELVAE